MVPADKTNRCIAMQRDEDEDEMINTLQKISYPIDIKSIKTFKL